MNALRVPPGPTTFDALRGVRSFGGRDFRNVPRFFTHLQRRYGPLAHWRIGAQHVYFVTDPLLVEELLVAKAREYKKGRGVERLRPLLGNGLLTSEPPDHLRRRRLMQPAFARERIAAYGREMTAAAAAAFERWPSDGVLAVDAEMTTLTLAIAARTLFGTDVAADAAAIRQALTTVMRAFPATLSPLYEFFETLPLLPVVRRFRRARAELDRVVYGIMRQRRAHAGEPHDDLLSLLLAARDGDDTLDDVEVRDDLLTLFIAGHETTANALAWACYELARAPALARRVQAEIDAVSGGRYPDPDDVPALTFTRDVFAEALRLYPPAWVVSRRALRDTTLGTWRIPARAIVIASQFVTQRDPQLWPEPERFDPDRWRSAHVPAERFAYFPFGGGNRRCIGDTFAWMEGVLILATLLGRYDLEPAGSAPVLMDPLITLRPTTVALRVRRRVTAAPAPSALR